MKTLSTLVFLALAVQCTLAASERKLLRSGYDSPVNFSDLPSLTDVKTNKFGSEPSVPGVNQLSKSGILPGTDSLPSGGLGKDILPTDLTTVASGRSELQSGVGSITKGVKKSGKVPSLPTSTTGGKTQGLTDSVSGLSGGLSHPSTFTSGGKQTYKSGVQSEDRSLNSPKKGLQTPQPKKNNKKRTLKKRGSGAAAKNSHKPNVKPTPKPDPEQSPFQHSVE
ncbi:hypothetical protein DVH05_012726 [Phytophthora capsici]|nr:hypothetical protein DVH05_012726 [Phytophthora capsici]